MQKKHVSAQLAGLFLFTLLLAACSKDDEDETTGNDTYTASVVGTWQNVTSVNPMAYTQYQFERDGTGRYIVFKKKQSTKNKFTYEVTENSIVIRFEQPSFYKDIVSLYTVTPTSLTIRNINYKKVN